MTTLTDTQVITASGGLVELGYSQRTTNVQINTASSSPGITVIDNLTFVSDGSPLLIEFSATNVSPTSPSYLAFNLWIDGVMSGQIGAFTASFGRCDARRRVTLSAGSHTVKVTGYYAGGGSGGWVYSGDATSGNDHPAFLRVSKIVTATQWPAVTTGTIICTSSTRPASPFVGQSIYETDTSLAYTYNGSAWVQTGDSTGAWTTWTPAVTQSALATTTNGGSRYTRIGRTIHANGILTVTGSGSAGTIANISIPVACNGVNQIIGAGWLYDASASTRYAFVAEANSSTTFVMNGDWSGVGSWGNAPSIGLASSDQIRFSLTYEAAS